MHELRQSARAIKQDTYALWLACRDERVPWYAKVLAGLVIAYALSPIDLIPDFIPVLGLLDDLILVPGGLVLVRRLIPEAVMEEQRERAKELFARGGPSSTVGAATVLTVWLLVLGSVAFAVFR